MNRRKFLKAAAGVVVGSPLAGLGYGRLEAGWIHVTRHTVTVPRLPPPFAGLKVALLTDIHHGPYNSLDYIRTVVRRANALGCDLIALGGDYSDREAQYIAPCFEVLAGLRAPLGVLGVMGNHDYWHGIEESRRGIQAAGIPELRNAGRWLARDGSRLRLAGVDDLWEGEQDLDAALADATAADACILLSHNPDYAETLRDPRVGLVLSGHTHGGQIYFPFYGAPRIPSRYGQKYLGGLVQAPATQVFVSRGLGVVGVPFRFCARPEINVLTLQRGTG